MMNLKKSALAFVALATVATVTVACGSKKKGDSNPGGDVAVKFDDTPANFACLGSAHTVSMGSAITLTVHTVSQTVSGTPSLAGAFVSLLNPTTGSTSGLASVTTNANGFGQLATTDYTRIAFKASKNDGTHVDTYQFNTLTGAASTTSANAYTIRVIDSTTYSAFIGLIGLSQTDVAGTTQFAAAVVDCDGDALKNVVVKTVNRCAGHTSFPCVAYFNGAAPSPNPSQTDASGQFVVAGVTPGAPYTVTMQAITTDGGALEDIGSITIYGKADAVALGTVDPYSN